MTAGKVLKRSLKSDQPCIFSLNLLELKSKIWVIVKEMGLKKIATKFWRAITPKNLQHLYQTMPERIQAIIDAGGNHTNYQNSIFEIYHTPAEFHNLWPFYGSFFMKS